jgi:hypothetical protein
MTQRKRLSESLAQYASSPPASPKGRTELRGPRVRDPFACETLAYPRLSPLEAAGESLDEPTVMRPALDPLQTMGIPCEPEEPTVMRPALDPRKAMGVPYEQEEPTVVYRPWARQFALTVSTRGLDVSLATTIAKPVLAPMAAKVGVPVPRLTAPSGPTPAPPPHVSQTAANSGDAPATRTPLLQKCIAFLIVAAVALLGVRELTKRNRGQAGETARAATSASIHTATTASAPPSSRVANTHDAPLSAAIGPIPSVNGKTPERQAVDLIARGAYSEAAALYERLARFRDVPAFREAARIAQRKARLSK